MPTTKRLDAITRELIEAIARKKAAEPSKPTANRHLALIRAILRRAWQQWEWIERVPKITLYPESKRRIRWITPSEAIRLLNELPDHQRDTALCALNTGLRQANVLGLKWSQIDLERACAWIHADEAKGRRPIAMPLNTEALAALGRQRGRHAEHVFTFRGELRAHRLATCRMDAAQGTAHAVHMPTGRLRPLDAGPRPVCYPTTLPSSSTRMDAPE